MGCRPLDLLMSAVLISDCAAAVALLDNLPKSRSPVRPRATLFELFSAFGPLMPNGTSLIPCLRHSSAVFMRAWCGRSTPLIWSPANRPRRITRLDLTS